MRKRTKEFYEKMNRVMEKLAKTHLSPNESKYCWALFRKTFGYGEYKEFIKRGLMSFLTGLSRSRVSYIKKRLKERNIIFEKSSVMGFNLNTDQWEMLQVSGTFKMLQVSVPNVTDRGYKNVTGIGPLLRTNKVTSPKKEDFYKKLLRKEIEKLELEQWYQAVMWNYGKFSKDYIEKTIKDYDYNTRMSCWYIYEDSGNIRNKEAYFSHLLRNYQEDLKK